jgi:hypothetical protein
MTPDFMDKVAKNPNMLRALSDPRMTPLLEEMQSNPAEAAKKLKVGEAINGLVTPSRVSKTSPVHRTCGM